MQFLSSLGSGILKEAITLTRDTSSTATHFALCNGSKIKYLIELHEGIPNLRKTIAAYDKKLSMLLYILPLVPWWILKISRLGYFVKVSLHETIAKSVPQAHNFNILVGTYDDKQKLILQCFSSKNEPSTFVKIGNCGSDSQMEREITFLRQKHQYTNFNIPQLQSSILKKEGAPFNIQVTKDFQGRKIPPVFTKDLLLITEEIAGTPIDIGGVLHTFSHGDFAPWNIRKNTKTYTVFDWEHYGLRPRGYDAAYFIIMTEIALNHCNFDTAFDIAKRQLKQLAPHIELNREKIRNEFSKTTKALKF